MLQMTTREERWPGSFGLSAAGYWQVSSHRMQTSRRPRSSLQHVESICMKGLEKSRSLWLALATDVFQTVFEKTVHQAGYHCLRLSTRKGCITKEVLVRYAWEPPQHVQGRLAKQMIVTHSAVYAQAAHVTCSMYAPSTSGFGRHQHIQTTILGSIAL